MNRRKVSQGLAWIAASSALAPVVAWAADDHDHDEGNDARLAATVSFGAGLNTAQPGNAANHHVLPSLIKVRRGGVVNFIVAGFHQVMVYNPGVTAATIAVPTSGLFINDTNNLYYQGIAPAGAPPAGVSNASNRVESVSFADAGDYLVICNVRPHFLDGMHAIIRVR